MCILPPRDIRVLDGGFDAWLCWGGEITSLPFLPPSLPSSLPSSLPPSLPLSVEEGGELCGGGGERVIDDIEVVIFIYFFKFYCYYCY